MSFPSSVSTSTVDLCTARAWLCQVRSQHLRERRHRSFIAAHRLVGNYFLVPVDVLEEEEGACALSGVVGHLVHAGMKLVVPPF